MTSQSAAKAISPAIERTKYFLFKPFELGRFLKLTLVATLVEGGFSSFNFNSHMPSQKMPQTDTPFHWPHIDWSMAHWAVVLFAVGFLIVVPIAIALSYLLIRLRFAYFECVLRLQDRISTGWSLYHRQALRFLGLTLLIGIGFWVVMIPIGYGIYLHFKPLFVSIAREMNNLQTPDFSFFSLVPLFAVLAPLFLALILASYLVHVTLGCFVLPRMALEDASIGEALSDVWSDFVLEPWQFLLFAFLRALLSMAATILSMIAMLIPAGMAAVVGVILFFVLKSASTAVAVAITVPLGIVVVGGLILIAIGLSGTIGTFQRNYALLFYGGRYLLLGDILQPPAQLPPLSPWDHGYLGPPPRPYPGA